LSGLGEINKFMTEIIRLLTDLVQAVKTNEDLIRETQNIAKNTQMMVESISQSAGIKSLESISQGLEDTINLLQKGTQAIGIQQALRQVQDFLGEMGGISPVSEKGSTVSFQAPPKTQKKPSSSDDSLVKPSDLFG